MPVYNLYSIDLLAKTEKCQIFLHIFLQLFELIIDLCPIESSKRKKKNREHKRMHLMFNQNTKLNRVRTKREVTLTFKTLLENR